MNRKVRKGTRAVIYVRISLDRDNETSTTTQEAECRKFAQGKGWDVAGVFVDAGRSGFKQGTPRPEYDKALAMVVTGQADVFLVWKLDRMTRNLQGFVKAWGQIEQAGGQFASVVESWFDTTETMGKLSLLTVATFAEMESQMKRDRALPWHEYRRGKGLPHGGPTPFGYTRTRNELTVQPEEAQALQEAAAMFVSGSSLQQIADRVNEMTGRNFDRAWVKRTLAKPVVYGYREHEGELFQGNWEPILTDEVWEAVKGINSGRACANPGTAGRHMLSGVATCGRCGGRMGKGVIRQVAQYRCTDCQLSINLEHAERAVSAFLLASVDQQAWESLRTQGKGYNPAVIQALEDEAQELADMQAAGELTMQQFRTMNQAVRARMEAATGQEPLQLPDIKELNEATWGSLSNADKRMTIQTLLESVTVRPMSKGFRGMNRVTCVLSV